MFPGGKPCARRTTLAWEPGISMKEPQLSNNRVVLPSHPIYRSPAQLRGLSSQPSAALPLVLKHWSDLSATLPGSHGTRRTGDSPLVSEPISPTE